MKEQNNIQIFFKNYKESNRVTLHRGDCMELLKKLPDNSVDLVVASPPYCIGKAYEDPHNDIEFFKKTAYYLV